MSVSLLAGVPASALDRHWTDRDGFTEQTPFRFDGGLEMVRRIAATGGAFRKKLVGQDAMSKLMIILGKPGKQEFKRQKSSNSIVIVAGLPAHPVAAELRMSPAHVPFGFQFCPMHSRSNTYLPPTWFFHSRQIGTLAESPDQIWRVPPVCQTGDTLQSSVGDSAKVPICLLWKNQVGGRYLLDRLCVLSSSTPFACISPIRLTTYRYLLLLT